ncbi:MAG: hypothetical protein HRT47_08035 [Candidatus Caenarcaniphilales bacterium]|nr:hypothetical protein [Candidatus Caenarcaniphilales bacterium]
MSFYDENAQAIKKIKYTFIDIQAFSISIKDTLKLTNQDTNFLGSVEVEIFSSQDLRFSFPAVVLILKSQKFASFVHTCQRIFNTSQDQTVNHNIIDSQSGFDILPDNDLLPYIFFCNGNSSLDNTTLNCEFINNENQTFKKKINLTNLKARQVCWVDLLSKYEKEFFNKQKGLVNIKHNIQNSYPRFIVGNYRKDKEAISITHTFYNSSNKSKDNNNYVKNYHPQMYFDYTVSVPCSFKGDSKYPLYSELVIYPLHCQFDYNYECLFFDKFGTFIAKSPVYSNKEGVDWSYINFRNILGSFNQMELLNTDLIAQVNFSSANNEVSKRFKLGLNIGQKNKEFDIPSNICFAAFYPLENYPTQKATLRWLPLVKSRNSFFIVTNFSQFKSYSQKAQITISFWSQSKHEPIKKEITIQPNGSYWFYLNENLDIKNHLNDENGWVSISSNNYWIYTWYFTDNGSGIFGGDHGF